MIRGKEVKMLEVECGVFKDIIGRRNHVGGSSLGNNTKSTGEYRE